MSACQKAMVKKDSYNFFYPTKTSRIIYIHIFKNLSDLFQCVNRPIAA